MRINAHSTSQRGGALLAVLWLSVALSAIAFSVANSVRGETERTSTTADSLRAYYLATGSVDRAILWIYWGIYGQYTNPDGSPKYYRAPMPYIRYSYPEGEVLVEVIPEAGKLNINTAKPEEIISLLYTLGINADRAAQIAQRIIDYRTAAEDTQPPSNSSFQARHASLEELEEILLVPGMTPDIFYGRFDRDPSGRLVPRGGLRDCLTVWGAANRVDINTAAPALLESLGLPAQLVQQIVARRTKTPFKTQEEIQAMVQGAGPEAARLGIGGATIWSLRATARLRLPGGQLSDVRRTVAAAVKFLDPAQFNPPYHVLRWYDDAWSPAVIPF